MDDFEWLEASLGQFALGEFLKAFDTWDPERVYGVRHFVSASPRYQGTVEPPDSALDAGAGVLERMGRNAFGLIRAATRRPLSDALPRIQPPW